MEGRAWPDDEDLDDDAAIDEDEGYVEGEEKGPDRDRGREGKEKGTREGKWESGAGRCAITGRKILGGTEGLRRVVV